METFAKIVIQGFNKKVDFSFFPSAPRRAGKEKNRTLYDSDNKVLHKSLTRRGYTCQPWASQSLHEHGFTLNVMYADGSIQDASNYCRNPDWDYDKEPWHYTTDPFYPTGDNCDVRARMRCVIALWLVIIALYQASLDTSQSLATR